MNYQQPIEQLCNLGRVYVERNWSRGTSSNYSIVVERDPTRLLITASGRHKEQLTPEDFVVVDEQGRPTDEAGPRSSAETLLHVAVAQDPEVGSILHTHSVWSTLLSERYFEAGELRIAGYEMLKGLTGVKTHETEVRIRIFENTQDIATLAKEVAALRAQETANLRHGLLLKGHGLYTWGSDFLTAKRHVEVLEFLFEVTGRKLSWPAT